MKWTIVYSLHTSARATLPGKTTTSARRTTVLAAIISGIALSVLGLTVPAYAATTRYEAESAGLAGGAVVSTEHTGYSGSGFVAGYTDADKGIAATTFTVSVAAAGNTALALRYANGSGAVQTLSLSADGGAVQHITLPATTDWNTWATQTSSLTLAAGSHTLTYAYGSADSGNVNLDALDVSPVASQPGSGASTGPLLEAESGALSGGAVVATDHTGYTGSGFVGGFTDGNKGAARVAVQAIVGTAGSYDLALRYANGNGSAKTLSLSIDGGANQQVSLPATTDWNTWGTVTTTSTLTKATHTIAYSFGSSDTGNVNVDSVTVSATSTTTPPPTSAGPATEAETAFLSGGPAVATSTTGFTGTGYVSGFTATGARMIRTVSLGSAVTATATIRFQNTSGSARSLAVLANGTSVATATFVPGSGWQTTAVSVPLRAGLNTLGLQATVAGSDIAIDSVVVASETAPATRGATVPYTEYEAEAASTTGTIMPKSRAYLTEQSEASGRSEVKLSATGQKVDFTLTQPTNSIVIRYSMPDSADGSGITAPIALYANGTKVKDITLSSVYAWTYGAYPYTNTPSQGSGHHFFDETRALIGSYPAGTVLTLQKDASSTAAYYDIDLIDTEVVAPALTQPAGSLSVTSYGATGNDTTDDTAALNAAISAAESQGKVLWLPTGTYRITSRLNVQGVTIRGAGMWYSVIQGTTGKGGFFATGSNVTLADFTVSGDVRYRDDTNFDSAIEGNFGTGSFIENVWMEHTKVGMWIDSGTDGLYAVDVRIRDTFADGVNLHANVKNTRIDQSVVRNTGDDALAMFSDGAPVTNGAFTFDTVQTPVLANGIGIYGGTSNRATDNVISDTVTAAAGIAVGTRFNPVPLSGTTTIARNTLARTGSLEPNWNSQLGALWIYADTADITTPIAVSDMTITDSLYAGVLMSYNRQITGPKFTNVTINGAGTYGFDIQATGSAQVSTTTVSNAASGGVNNPSGYTLVRGSGNSGF